MIPRNCLPLDGWPVLALLQGRVRFCRHGLLSLTASLREKILRTAPTLVGAAGLDQTSKNMGTDVPLFSPSRLICRRKRKRCCGRLTRFLCPNSRKNKLSVFHRKILSDVTSNRDPRYRQRKITWCTFALQNPRQEALGSSLARWVH
jgi:hypothetical protein